MVAWLMTGLVSWLAEQVQALLGALLTFLTSSIFLSPDVTVLPQVTTIAGKASLIVNACFILAILTVGIATMVGGSVEMRYGIKDLLPRLVVGFVMSNFAIPLCAVLIEVANSLTTAMVGTASPTTEAVTMARTRVGAAIGDPANALLGAIIGLLIVALFFTLVTGWITRVAVLVILAGIAPVAMACYSLPWTQGAAQLWWRSMLGCLGTATLQALAFSTGIQLISDPNANLPILLALPGSDVMNLLLIVVVLWATIKIPGMMRKFATRQGQQTNMAGIVLRSVVMQTVTNRLPFVRGGR